MFLPPPNLSVKIGNNLSHALWEAALLPVVPISIHEVLPGSLPGSELSTVWDYTSVQSGVSFDLTPPSGNVARAAQAALPAGCQRERHGGGPVGTVVSPAGRLRRRRARSTYPRLDFTATAKAPVGDWFRNASLHWRRVEVGEAEKNCELAKLAR